MYSNYTILYMFRTSSCSSSGGYFCTRSIQYFTTHLWTRYYRVSGWTPLRCV